LIDISGFARTGLMFVKITLAKVITKIKLVIFRRIRFSILNSPGLRISVESCT
jgi:hypothetical protein